MEVHPPHEPVHSWRDALIHVGLMTVGLFIALTLEGALEYVHHRELVHHARENLHQELEHNHEAAQKNLRSVKAEQARAEAGIDTIHRFQKDPNGHGSIEFHWDIGDLSDAAWRSARDTGALGYMPYNEVQSYAALYGIQTTVNDQLKKVSLREPEVLGPLMAHGDFKGMSPPQFDLMLNNAAEVYLDLQTLGQYLEGLDKSYVEELKRQP